jgi:hypothetical protein
LNDRNNSFDANSFEALLIGADLCASQSMLANRLIHSPSAIKLAVPLYMSDVHVLATCYYECHIISMATDSTDVYVPKVECVLKCVFFLE